MPKKVSSDFSYTLTYLTLKYERNRIFHPCRVMFDFYRQALLSTDVPQTQELLLSKKARFLTWKATTQPNLIALVYLKLLLACAAVLRKSFIKQLSSINQYFYLNRSCEPVALSAMYIAPQNPRNTIKNTTLKRVMSR